MKYLSEIKDVFSELKTIQETATIINPTPIEIAFYDEKIIQICDELEEKVRIYYKNSGEDKVLIKVEDVKQNIEESDICIYEGVILSQGVLFNIEMYSTSKPKDLDDCIKWNKKELILSLI